MGQNCSDANLPPVVKTVTGLPNTETYIGEGLELFGNTFASHEKVHEHLTNQLKSVVTAESFISGGNSGDLESSLMNAINGGAAETNDKFHKLHSQISSRVENLIGLRSILKSSFEKLYDLAKNHDKINKDDLEYLHQVQDKILKENDNQLSALQHVLDMTIKPTHEEVKAFLNKHKDFSKLIKFLGKAKPGSKEMSNKLALTFSGIHNYNALAQKVDKALKKVGMTEHEYVKIEDLHELKHKLSEILKKMISGDLKDKKLHDVFKAMHLLEHSMVNHDKITKFLGKNKEKTLEDIYEKHGGAAREVSSRKLGHDLRDNLVNRLRETQQSLAEIIRYFVEDVNKQFSSLSKSIEVIAPLIGSEIPYDQSMINFIEAYADLDDFSNAEFLYANLLEIHETTQTKEEKNRFMKYLDNIILRINELEKGPEAKYFEHIKKNIQNIKESIDTFSDSVKTLKKRVKKGGDDKDDDDDVVYEYSNEFKPELFKIDDNLIQSLQNNIIKTTQKLTFFGNLASIRQNMTTMSKEINNYSEDYEKLLGKAIADQISHLNRVFVANMNSLDDETSTKGLLFKSYNDTASDKDKLDKSLIKGIYQWQYDARVELYKTIEAIDLYLIKFTDAVASNPDAVADLSKMLASTKVITKWYNEKSGENLIDVFETFATGATVDINITDYKTFIPADIITNSVTGDMAKKAFDNCKKSIDGIVVLKNVLSFFIHIGEKFGNKDIQSKMHMSPNTIYKNLVKYIWASAFWMDDSALGFPVKLIQASPLALKDLTLKGRTGSVEERNIKMINLIGRKLLDRLPLFSDMASMATDNEYMFQVQQFTNLYNKIYDKPVVSIVLDTTDIGKFKKTLHDKLIEINNKLNNTGSLGSSTFTTEDTYFILTMKAMVAKVLTVVGTHSLYKRPDLMRNKLMNPVRLVLGGAASSSEIIPEAVELYIRLPLIVEFYRNIFDKGNTDYKKQDAKLIKDETEMVAYVPEVGGTWSGLIQLIFDKSKYIDNNFYTDANIKSIIKEVNNIYNFYIKTSNKKEIVKTTILGLVAEINRRYGIIKRSDLGEYYKYTEDEEEMFNVSKIQKMRTENLDYDIFGDSKEIEYSGPSEQYIQYNLKTSSNEYKQYMKTADYEIVKDFRAKVSAELNNAKINGIYTDARSGKEKPNSLNNQVKYYKNKIMNSPENKRYEIVVKAIEDINNISSSNKDVQVMFHEVVTMPLNILYGLYKYSEQFLTSYHDNVYKLATVASLPTENPNISKIKAVLVANYDSGVFSKGTPFDVSKLLALLNSFSNDMDGLVELKFISDKKILLNTSKLQEYVESSLNNIKYMISKFTNTIPKDIIKKYENIDVEGSIYYLEDKFINRMLNNKNKKTEKIEYQVLNFDSVNLSLPYIIDLSQSTEESITIKPYVDMLYEQIMFITYDKSSIDQTPLADTFDIRKDIFRIYDLTKKVWLRVDNLTFTNFVTQKLDKKGIYNNDAILSKFNTLVISYLDQFYDTSSKKIYGNLFTSFASDIIANLPNGRGFIDHRFSDQTQTKNTFNHYFPNNNTVIAGSLSYTIKVLLNRTLNRQLPEKYHLNPTLNDVAPHMVEKMKSQLPIFIKMFELLIRKCILYKKLLDTNTIYKTGVTFPINNISEKGGVATILDIKDENNQDLQISDNFINSTSGPHTIGDRINTYRNILDNIIDATRCIINDATTVLNEIIETDKSSNIYFDVKKDFTKNFYSNTKEYPFMPLSIMTTFLGKFDKNILIPYSGNTLAENKFMYGVRGTLLGSTQLKLDNAIYVKNMFEKYNNYSNKINNIESDKITEFMNININLLKFLYEKRIYNSFVDMHSKLYDNITQLPIDNTHISPTIEIDSKLESIISMVENTVVENSENVISEFIGKGSKSTYDRSNTSLINIIDLNIVPINIHALMREIPLINIYNYANTFDEFVNRDVSATSTDVPEAMFNKLLIDPYVDIGTIDWVATCATPIKKLNIEKPRFLSDEIYNKIYNLYNTSDLVDKTKQVARLVMNTSRLDTKLVRNIVFLVNLQRFIKYSIRNEMEIINERVVDSSKAVSDQITEFKEPHPYYDDNEFEFKY